MNKILKVLILVFVLFAVVACGKKGDKISESDFSSKLSEYKANYDESKLQSMNSKCSSIELQT